MPNVNKAILIGRLTRDPANSSTRSGNHLCRFTLAVNHKYTGQDGQQREDVDFVDVLSSGRLADTCSLYLHKGEPTYIEGRIHIFEWKDKNGISHKSVEIIAERMELLVPKNNQRRPLDEVDPSVERAFQGVNVNSTPTPAPYPAQRPNVPPAPVAPLTPPTQEDASDSYDNPSDDGVF